MTMQRRRIVWIVAIGTPIVCILAYIAYWLIAAEQLKATIARWQDEQRAAGLHIDHGGLSLNGFPGPFQITVKTPRLAQRTSIQSWSWSSQQLVARTGPWSFDRIRGEIVGDHRLVVETGSLSTSHVAVADMTKFVLSGATDHGSASLRLRNVSIDGDLLPGSFVLDGGQLTLTARRGDDGEPDVVIDLDAFGLRPPPAAVRVAEVIDRLSVRAIWTGPIPDALSYRALADWRDDGGAVEFPRTFIKSGKVSLSADGTLALDAAMRPLAAFRARVQGFEEAIQMLTDAQNLSPTQGAAARIALRLLAKRGGQPGSVEFPLTIQGGRAYVGEVPVARVKPIFRSR